MHPAKIISNFPGLAQWPNFLRFYLSLACCKSDCSQEAGWSFGGFLPDGKLGFAVTLPPAPLCHETTVLGSHNSLSCAARSS